MVSSPNKKKLIYIRSDAPGTGIRHWARYQGADKAMFSLTKFELLMETRSLEPEKLTHAAEQTIVTVTVIRL
jgi:hypothetical protein